MIPNEKGCKAKSEGRQRWHHLAELLRRITSKRHCDFYCLSCSHSLLTERKLESRKRVCENKDFCNVIMPS